MKHRRHQTKRHKRHNKSSKKGYKLIKGLKNTTQKIIPKFRYGLESVGERFEQPRHVRFLYYKSR